MRVQSRRRTQHVDHSTRRGGRSNLGSAAAFRAAIAGEVGIEIRTLEPGRTRAKVAFLVSPEELGEIEQAVPPGAAAGERYPEVQLAHMDSERSH